MSGVPAMVLQLVRMILALVRGGGQPRGGGT